MAERANLLTVISDFKAALSRREDTSDSDEDDIAHGTNRGQKLKRKSRFVHEGSLNAPVGNKLYEEEIEYANRKRKILYRKRKRAADSDDDDVAEDGEEDPYANVRLEKILAPAQTPSDIANHPSLSAPYKSRTLNELCQQSLDIISTEHTHTMALKRLLTQFLGDEPFVNLEKMETIKEPEMVRAAREMLQQLETQRYEEEQQTKMVEEATRAAAAAEINGDAKKEDDVDMKDTSRHGSPADARKSAGANGEAKDSDQKAENKKGGGADKAKAGSPPTGDQAGNGGDTPSRRMTTRSAVTTTNSNAIDAEKNIENARQFIDSFEPWFYRPLRDSNSRDFGLNPVEAEETRRLLLLAVQKQEEFVRGLNNVRNVLLKADRMRTKVWEWCRADGQEEPSDGEDWVDLERWGLQPGELRKGAEEEEEDDPKRKTTRGRRN